MNNSSTSAVTSKKSESEISHNQSNKQVDDDLITITETISLKRRQYKVLKIISDTHRLSISEYIQEALIEAMTSDIEEGNFCETLLEKIDNDDDNKSKNNNFPRPPPSPDSFAPDIMMKNDLLKKLGTETL
jgi:hypothetical protein